jgi:dTDP-4-dehydrorhamnose 3,5-epimerase
MIVEQLSIEGVKIIVPRKFEDDRGYFSETFKIEAVRSAGIDADFIQDNLSMSVSQFTLRGLHYQRPPHAQSKLVRVLAGRILDVVVDARVGSPTFGNWVSAELTALKGEQIFVPQGCLHGFLTLEPNTLVSYKVDAYYHAPSDGSVCWNDAQIGIDWGLPSEQRPILSQKDANAQTWLEFVQNGQNTQEVTGA